MKKEKATPKSSPSIQSANDNSYQGQRTKILRALREVGSQGLTTIQIRERLGVIAPAPRIFELRHDYDYRIETLRTFDENAQGRRHYVARYVLLEGRYRDCA